VLSFSVLQLFQLNFFEVFIVSLILAARSVHLLTYFITIMHRLTVQIVELPDTQLSAASDYCLPLKDRAAAVRSDLLQFPAVLTDSPL